MWSAQQRACKGLRFRPCQARPRSRIGAGTALPLRVRVSSVQILGSETADVIPMQGRWRRTWWWMCIRCVMDFDVPRHLWTWRIWLLCAIATTRSRTRYPRYFPPSTVRSCRAWRFPRSIIICVGAAHCSACQYMNLGETSCAGLPRGAGTSRASVP